MLLLIYAVAWYVRPRVCDETTSRYFFPALTLKLAGALAVGFIYQFYYDGGDTFNYHTFGSRRIWEIFIQDPGAALKMIFLPKSMHNDLFQYTSRIYFYHDDASYFMIRVVAFFDLFTFSSYSSTALLFAVLSFTGACFLYTTFYRTAPELHFWIAVAIFFVPSVFFWGSGILKDSLVMAFLGMMTYAVQRLFLDRRWSIGVVLLLLASLLVIFMVKKYVLLCFLPAVILWILYSSVSHFRSALLRLMLIPMVLIVAGVVGYYTVDTIGANDPRYALDRLAMTARVTAYDIGFYTGKDAGSGYSLGELDGTFGGMLRLAPQAINVSLFRPYLWEVKNPLMLLSALESIVLLVITSWIVVTRFGRLVPVLLKPIVSFCLLFSITFAFAVGVSTFNFGTLVRYKIPMLPFYAMTLTLIWYYSNRPRKSEELEITE